MGVTMDKELSEIANKIHDADMDLVELRNGKHNYIYEYEVDEISGVINFIQFKIKGLKERIQRRLEIKERRINK
tara:strand:+ start:38 stop:259 length:222 start_codon:yes stop_codon:yes gene_type:complete